MRLAQPLLRIGGLAQDTRRGQMRRSFASLPGRPVRVLRRDGAHQRTYLRAHWKALLRPHAAPAACTEPASPAPATPRLATVAQG